MRNGPAIHCNTISPQQKRIISDESFAVRFFALHAKCLYICEPAVESFFDQGSEDIREETVMRMAREMPLLPVLHTVED